MTKSEFGLSKKWIGVLIVFGKTYIVKFNLLKSVLNKSSQAALS